MKGYRWGLGVVCFFLLCLSWLQSPRAGSTTKYESEERAEGTVTMPPAQQPRIAQLLWQQQLNRQKAQQEVAHKAQLEAQKREAARKAELEAQQKAQQEAARKAQIEAQRKAMLSHKAEAATKDSAPPSSNETLQRALDMQQQIQENRKKQADDEAENKKR